MKVFSGSQLTVPGADRWYDAIRAGRAFSAVRFFSPVAGQYGHIQLLNPVGSGVTCILRGISASPSSASAFYLNRHDIALTNSIANGINLLVGGAASAARIRDESIAAVTGTPIRYVNAPGTDNYQLGTEWNIELPAGSGILVACLSVTVSHWATFEWIEL